MRTRVVVGVVLAVAVGANLVLANDDSDRRDLLDRIDRKLDDAARELSNLDRKSDTSDLDDAQSDMREVEELVNDLKSVKGDDSTANHVVDAYPDYIRGFREAITNLRDLKTHQPDAPGYLQQCRTLDAAMTAKANAATDDPDGASALREFARTTGQKGADLLSDAAREWNDLQHEHDDARRFSASEGHWSDVRSNVISDDDAITDLWRDNFEKAKSACEEVVKREHHRDVERALDKLANSSAGRADLRRRIDEQLDAIADRLKGVESQSDDSYVKAAIENTQQLETLLGGLANAAGDDRDARAIASTWPAWVKQLRESLEALKQMKLNQRIVDQGPAACAAAESALAAEEKQVLEDRDQYPDPERTLDDDADRIAQPLSAGMKGAAQVDRQMNDWRDKAKSFSQSDSKWASVSSNLRDSADRIYAYWRSQDDSAIKACAMITQGRSSPILNAVIAQWRSAQAALGDQLEHDINDWVQRARATYRLDCQAMDDLWQAYCGTDFGPDDPDAEDYPKQTAARLQDQMQAAMKPVLDELPKLVERVQPLLKKKETKPRGERLKAELDKQRERLQRLSVQDVWRGANDPVRFFAAEYGKQQHARLWSSEGCKVPTGPDREARFPGDGPNKPDCVNPSKCQVWEFKPKSDRGERAGRDQADNYRRIVPAYYNAMYRQKNVPEAALGGQEVMDALVANCLKDGEIKLQVAVETYNMCDKRYVCVSE